MRQQRAWSREARKLVSALKPYDGILWEWDQLEDTTQTPESEETGAVPDTAIAAPEPDAGAETTSSGTTMLTAEEARVRESATGGSLDVEYGAIESVKLRQSGPSLEPGFDVDGALAAPVHEGSSFALGGGDV